MLPPGSPGMVAGASTYNARSWVEANADLYDWREMWHLGTSQL